METWLEVKTDQKSIPSMYRFMRTEPGLYLDAGSGGDKISFYKKRGSDAV